MFGALIILIALVLGLAILIVLAVLYLLNLQHLLNEVSPSRRKVPPSNVWLMLIPFFNLVYGFILYTKISESVKLEFEVRGAPKTGDYFRTLGIIMASVSVLRFILAFVAPNLGFYVGFGNFVIFIVYWVNMAGYKNQLRRLPNSDDFGLNSDSDLLDM